MLEGIDLHLGKSLLDSSVEELIWRGQSMFLVAGLDSVLRSVRFSRIGSDESLAALQNSVALAFQATDETVRWASSNSLKLLLPPGELVMRLSDKIEMQSISKRARALTPRSIVIADADVADAAELWRAFGGKPFVLQRRENNLTGRGTRRIVALNDLVKCLMQWRGHDLKATEFLYGVPLTISGCVTQSRTFSSAMSLQLVGLSRLTPVWGAHCGNRLVDDSELPTGVPEMCRAMSKSVGDVLRSAGFFGQFGLDVIASDGRVILLEINARVQSVSSLANMAELDADLLPMPALHLLSATGGNLPSPTRSIRKTRPFSQVVISSPRSGRARGELRQGTYRIEGSDLVYVSSDADVRRLDEQEAVIWPFIEFNSEISEGDRLVILQFPRAAAAIECEPSLYEWVESWIQIVERSIPVTEGSE